MISEDDVERAVNWLASSAGQAAKARAECEYLREYRKSLKALIMAEMAQEPITVQEREAYRDQRYTDHLEALRDAVEADERLRWLRTAAEAKISAWQTMTRLQRANV